MARMNRMDREWLNAEIDAVVRETDSLVKRDVAAALIAKMQAALDSGDFGYMPIVWAMAENGIIKAVADRIRQEHDEILTTPTGQVVKMPRYGAARQRDASGLATAFQMGLWTKFSRAEFDEMVADRLKRHDTEGKVIARYVAMQKVWDKHPEAKNVVEAIQLAGMSLSDFGIDVEGVA